MTLAFDAGMASILFTRLAVPAPCRVCGEPSYFAEGVDDTGKTVAVHRCCRGWEQLIVTGAPCPSCSVTGRARRAWAGKRAEPKAKRGRT